MEILNQLYQTAVNKILDWRNRYTEFEYPGKIVINMFYEIKQTEIIWEEVIKSYEKPFGGQRKAKFNNFRDAFDYIDDKCRNIQLNKVRANLEYSLNLNPIIGILDYRVYKNIAKKASNGNIKMIEELEFTYIWHSILNIKLLFFAAGGLMGWDELESYQKTCEVQVDNISFNDFKSAMEAYNQEVAMFMKMHYKPL